MVGTTCEHLSVRHAQQGGRLCPFWQAVSTLSVAGAEHEGEQAQVESSHPETTAATAAAEGFPLQVGRQCCSVQGTGLCGWLVLVCVVFGATCSMHATSGGLLFVGIADAQVLEAMAEAEGHPHLPEQPEQGCAICASDVNISTIIWQTRGLSCPQVVMPGPVHRT